MDTGSTAAEPDLGVWSLAATTCVKIVAQIFFATVVATKHKLLARNNKKMPLLPPKFNTN